MRSLTGRKGVEPKVVRAPRVPTQEERDAHEAIHIPHEEWCEVCVAGRGRNKALRKRKEAAGSSLDADCPGASPDEDDPVNGASSKSVHGLLLRIQPQGGTRDVHQGAPEEIEGAAQVRSGTKK